MTAGRATVRPSFTRARSRSSSRKDYCRRERVGPLAGKGCHRSAARRGLLGSRTRAPGLSGALSARLYVPLCQTQLEASCPKSRTGTHLIPYSWAPEDQIRGRLYQVSCELCSWNGDACSPFVFRLRRSSKRALRDRDLVCESRKS